MISRKPSKVVTGKDGFILDDLMSLTIKPMSELKMKYINMLRERSKDLLSACEYPDYIVSDVNLLRFVRGHMVRTACVVNNPSMIWTKPTMPSVRCSFGERKTM